MNAENPPKKQERVGAPAWVMTFADLMSLLMCFFVLLLSFSEMNLLKFKQIAGSMEKAFGVQRTIKAREAPKGTSVIAREFAPGRPTPTPLQQIRQNTIDEKKQTLQSVDTQNQHRMRVDIDKLSKIFADEIEKKMIRIEEKEGRIMIGIREKGLFPSGSSVVKSSFFPVLEKLKAALGPIEGKIVVAGHTDNVPIKTAKFQSNWALSAARAVAVTHALLEGSSLSSKRFIVEGYADVRPLADNLTAEGRELNRRVEITIIKSKSEGEIPYQSSEDISLLDDPSDLAGGIDEEAAADVKQQDIIDPEILNEKVWRLSNKFDVKEQTE